MTVRLVSGLSPAAVLGRAVAATPVPADCPRCESEYGVKTPLKSKRDKARRLCGECREEVAR